MNYHLQSAFRLCAHYQFIYYAAGDCLINTFYLANPLRLFG